MSDGMASLKEVRDFYGLDNVAFTKEWKLYTPEFRDEIRREVHKELSN